MHRATPAPASLAHGGDALGDDGPSRRRSQSAPVPVGYGRRNQRADETESSERLNLIPGRPERPNGATAPLDPR